MNSQLLTLFSRDVQVAVFRCFLVFAAFSAILLTAACAQNSPVAPKPPAAPKPPDEVLNEFLNMETSGARLTPEGWYKTASFFVHPSPMPKDISVIVVKYIPGVTSAEQESVGIKRGDITFYTGFTVLGQIDPALGFKDVPDNPFVIQPWTGFQYDLIFSDKFWKLSPDGLSTIETAGAPEWRITDSEPHIAVITVDAAIRYVAEMNKKSSDPIIQQNALKTISTLNVLNSKPPTFEKPAHVPDSPATDIVKEFCKEDADGVRLTPEGWRRVGQLFSQPAQHPLNQSIAIISRDYAVDQEDIRGNDIMVYVGYVDFGRLDSSLRLGPMPIPGGISPNVIIKTARLYDVVLSDRYWIPTQDGKLKEITGPPEWKIQGYDSTQWITIETALQYVTKMRARSMDPKIRKNADGTLFKLRRFLHPGKSRPSACACF